MSKLLAIDLNRAAVVSKQGPRPSMEDTHVLQAVGPAAVLGAIFDGHMGPRTAMYAEGRFINAWREDLSSGSSSERLGDALKKIHSEVTLGGLEDGACAVAFHLDGEYLSVANLGDAELVWVPDYSVPVTLTTAHRLDDFDEVQRIYQTGALIQKPYYLDPTSMRGMMPTRSLGDAWLDRWGLSHEPAESTMAILGPGWIVCACDGLWDKVEAHELPELLRPVVSAQDAAQTLVNEALAVRNSTDNVTVVCIRVKEENDGTV